MSAFWLSFAGNSPDHVRIVLQAGPQSLGHKSIAR
jgi:hypothetical protein